MAADIPQTLRRLAQMGQLAHAYLLSGEDPAALRRAADALAQAMVCAAPAGEKPCGVCRQCAAAAKGIHPDILAIAPEEGKELVVGQIRELRREAGVLPNQAARKVFILENAQKMNDSAQNAFLKVLEEGPGYAAFLLLTRNPNALLPTVRSRCEEVVIPASAADDPALTALGDDLAALLLGDDPWALAAWCVEREKLRREETVAVLTAARRGLLRDTRPHVLARAVPLAQGLGEIISGGTYNPNVGALWGWVAALPGETLGK